MLGYVYPAIAMSKRIAELDRIGFRKIVISSKTSENLKTKTEIIKIERISELYSLLNKNQK
jgi:predicted ATP-dependent serine protease